MPANHRKLLMVSSPRWNLLAIFLISLRKHFVYGVRHYVMTLAQNWSQTAISPLIDVARISTNLQVDGMRWRVITFFFNTKECRQENEAWEQRFSMSVCNGQNVLRVFLIKIASVAFLCLHSTQFSMNFITFQDTPYPGLFVVFFVAFCCIKLYTIYITWVVKC